ncbi:MAG: ferritin-like domain-containing protein [Verrucomicrobiales bacterium]|nr:ferritin-like domain-containing protein [Verrucomicrobiales bacterium]
MKPARTINRRAIPRKRGSREPEASDNPLHAAFLNEVADIYNAEQQLAKALPRLVKAAQSDELREAFETHLDETEQQAQRIEQALESLGETLKRKRCKAMEGLIKEGQEMMQEFAGEPSLDAVLIAAAQKMEHYEIASYGTMCAWAEQMGHTEALELLKENLAEEKAADEKLTTIAESVVNSEAQAAGM